MGSAQREKDVRAIEQAIEALLSVACDNELLGTGKLPTGDTH